MRTRAFLLIFAGLVFILTCSAGVIFLQMQVMKDVRPEKLEDKLYAENASILAWVMKNTDPERIDPAGMPPSWGEIMIVDNASLAVTSSTSRAHVGSKISAIPELLDQAAPVLASLGRSAPGTVSTKDYTIVLAPRGPGSTLVGLKPRAWEKGLLSEQSSQLDRGASSALRVLVGFLVAGVVLSLVLSLAIALVVSSPVSRAAKAFENLSLGDLEADLPRSGGKTFVSLADSFFRLKTSLSYALEKLGRG